MARYQGKYTDAFKSQLVAESRETGMTVSTVSKHHNVSTNQIYAWRQDERFQGVAPEIDSSGFLEVTTTPEIGAALPAVPRPKKYTSDARIEITLENGRKLSISEGVDAAFVLDLARGLAA